MHSEVLTVFVTTSVRRTDLKLKIITSQIYRCYYWSTCHRHTALHNLNNKLAFLHNIYCFLPTFFTVSGNRLIPKCCLLCFMVLHHVALAHNEIWHWKIWSLWCTGQQSTGHWLQSVSSVLFCTNHVFCFWRAPQSTKALQVHQSKTLNGAGILSILDEVGLWHWCWMFEYCRR